MFATMLATADAAGCIRAKGKRLVRRTILILATVVVLLVVVGGVAFALTCTGGTCYGTNAAEDIYGSKQNDRIYAYAGGDYINGRGGSDYIDGGSENDTIEGDGGSYPQRNDILVGGSENDWLYGNGGNNDRCDGGAGFDRAHRSCEFMIRIEETISY